MTDISKHEGFTPQEVFCCQLTVERCLRECVMCDERQGAVDCASKNMETYFGFSKMAVKKEVGNFHEFFKFSS